MQLSRVAVALLAVLSMACSSGKKAYERGNYYESVIRAVARLRQNPDHDKSLETLQNAYPLAVDYFETDVRNQIASNAPSKWRNAIASYDAVNSMYEQIRQCPGCLKVVPNPKEYYAQIGPLKEQAAEESYNLGIQALNKGNRMEARKAYYYFKDVQAFAPGYKEVNEYLNRAMYDATLKVVLEQIPVPSRYNLSGGFFQDNVESYLRSNFTENSFIRFYTPEEAQREQLKVADQILRLQFDDFTVGNVAMRENAETFSRDSVKVGEAKIDGKTIPVYNTVKAKLTTYRKEIISNGLLSMVVVDGRTNGVLDHRKFNGQFVWITEWGSFNGDERALTDAQLKICRLQEQQPPMPQELFLEFTRPIYDQLVPALRGFYQAF